MGGWSVRGLAVTSHTSRRRALAPALHRRPPPRRAFALPPSSPSGAMPTPRTSLHSCATSSAPCSARCRWVWMRGRGRRGGAWTRAGWGLRLLRVRPDRAPLCHLPSPRSWARATRTSWTRATSGRAWRETGEGRPRGSCWGAALSSRALPLASVYLRVEKGIEKKTDSTRFLAPQTAGRALVRTWRPRQAGGGAACLVRWACCLPEALTSTRTSLAHHLRRATTPTYPFKAST